MRRILSLLVVVCSVTVLTAQTNFKSGKQPGTSRCKKSEMTGFTSDAFRLLRHNREQSAKFVRRVKNNLLPAGKAEVVLEAHDVWDSGSIGYQMLLDAGHDTYGTLYDASGTTYDDNYDQFEYKIPGDADPVETTDKVIVEGEGKAVIPAGTYDYLITCPIPGDGIMLPGGMFARFDDFRFEQGYTYRFIVSLEQTELGPTDVVDAYADKDAAVDQLILPSNSMELTPAEPITVVIANRGISAISGFSVSYRIDGGKTITETFTGTIRAEQSVRYTFTAKADFSAEKSYEVKAWTNLPGDLIPYNDSRTGKCKHIGVAALPFTEDFSSGEDFETDWSIVNANDDYATWEYGEWWESPTSDLFGAAQCSTYPESNDDYLISPPVHLDNGNNYLTFYIRGVTQENEERIDIRYGQTPDGREMTILGEYAFKDSEYRMKAINFNVANSGTYYFAFHAKSLSGTSILLDDVTINRGTYAVSPELVIEKILLPYSNCDLSGQTPVGVRLSNKGTGPATSFTLSYTVNDGENVSQTFTETLSPDQAKTFYFDTPADLLDIGDYWVSVTAACQGKTTQKGASISHYAPVTEFPFPTDFYQDSGIIGNWTQMTEGTWEYNRMGGYYQSTAGEVANGLLSRCFTTDRPFRIKVAYTGGYFSAPATFYIAYGKPGTDVSTWKTIYEDTSVLYDVEREISVYPDMPGEYSIAVINTTENAARIPFGLYQLTLSQIHESDLRVSGVDTPLSAYMPVNHLRQESTYRIALENRGTQPLTGIRATLHNEKSTLATSEETAMIGSAAADTLTLRGSLPQPETGRSIALHIEAGGNEADQYPADNTWILPVVHPTDTVFATENLSSFANGTGLEGETAKFGNIYTLAETDTLTSVFVGLAQNNYYTPQQIGVAVYGLKADGTTLDRKLFSTTFEREAEGSFRKIGFTPRVLPAGKYYFEVQQLTTSNIGLAYETAENSYFYQNVNDTLRPIAGYGNIAVRAHFGHEAHAYQKNVGAGEITGPVKTKTLFSSAETIEATVENLGMEAVTDLEVVCTVNTWEKRVKVNLAPYEQQVVRFAPADLSVPGEYVVKIRTTLAGDENPADNETTRTFVSLPEANPYILDFESCDDFDAERQFNPRWWTVDRLNDEVDGWWQFDYPHNSEPVGFLAFNIEATTPPMSDELHVPGFFPHSGKRFGAAFCTSLPDRESDVWLISPRLQLSGHSSLELYVKTHALESPDARLERYKVLVSNTDDRFESFRVLGPVREAPEEWTQVTVDLNEYNNQKVYVALQYVSKIIEGVVMMVDDIRIVSDGVGIENTPAENGIRVWTDPAEKMLSVSCQGTLRSVEVYDLAGRIVYQSDQPGASVFRLSLTSYWPGSYTLRVQTDQGTHTSKFTVAP